MKIKTSELIGPALDWAVNECEYRRIIAAGEYIKEGVLERHRLGAVSQLDWQTGGEILERECVAMQKVGVGLWRATIDLDEGDAMRECQVHLDPLTALFRCYVASVLGNEVEIPEELI